MSTVEISSPSYTDKGSYHCTAVVQTVAETASSVDVDVLSKFEVSGLSGRADSESQIQGTGCNLQ